MTPERPFPRRPAAVLWLLPILLFFGADALGLFDGLNVRFYDAFFRARGVRPPSEKIVIVGIDDRSLQSLGRWPLDRILYARLLDGMSQASAVGLDLIFSESSSSDEPLNAAIDRFGRAVLAVYFDENLTRIPPAPSFTSGRLGHVHIERDVDQISRSLYHTLTDAAGPLPSLSLAVWETAAGRSPKPRDPVPAIAADGPRRLFQTDFSKINYYGPPGTFARVSLFDVLDGRVPASLFKDKLVLVGVTAVGLQDRSATPFSEARNEMPGVEIQANALGNLLDGTGLRDVSRAVAWPLNLALALLGFLAFFGSSERRAAWIWAAGLLGITAVSYGLFVGFNVWLGPGIFFLTSAYLFLAAYLLKLDAAARQLDGKVAALAAHSDKKEAAAGTRRRGLISLFSRKGINSKIRGLLEFEASYEGQLEEAVRDRTAELADALSTIQRMNNELIVRLARAVESRDESTGDHVARVAQYAQIIASAMGRPPEVVEAIAFTSSIHDIGKIGIPDHILLKKGPLTEAEKKVMRDHTLIGYEILSGSEHPRIQEAAVIALNHHERWDGTGYPAGLKGTDIPLEARIVAICDLYDALRSRRPYKSALNHEAAVSRILEGGDGLAPENFDPDVLRAFARSASDFADVFRRHQG